MHYNRVVKYQDPEKTKRARDGRAGHKLQQTYWSMITRCTNPKSISFKNYGERGIQVDSRWLGIDGFSTFVEDMGDRPDGHTLDRIDVNGNYCKENCRWASRVDQYAGRRDASSHIGVVWNKQKNKWQARITRNHTIKHIGFFHSIDAAISARDKTLKMEGYT